ncbi:transcriptional regulator [Streptomyces corchorusii]|uniref:Transcriptional regulator n=2 Tax=Streptomyces TaxID=1883 RepID=A0A101PV63_STRCK|nr:LuxR family transcriptional regulator [Streptomyces corchorusii]KUN18246.1 transcriptional regulator [Streptomyces corchorusii]
MIRGRVEEDPLDGIIGREPEISRVLRGLFPNRAEDAGALLLVGEPGMGKTALLHAVAAEAGQRGTVLRCAGSQAERTLAYGALHQLLRPVLNHLPELPAPQGAALSRALGMRHAAARTADAEGGDERLLVGLASLNLLLASASHRPVTIFVDDLQWLDDASLETLLFVARRTAGEPVGLLAAVRGDGVSGPGWPDFEPVPLGPLSGEAAGRLLDAQPVVPRGRVRGQVLRLAAGNPLALMELARDAEERGFPGWDTAVGAGFSLPARLEKAFAERLDGLPEATRRVLLFAAAADGPDMRAALSAAASVPGGAAEAWAAAEDAGLVRLVSGRVEFRQPLMRSAVYATASFAERREVHLRLADGLDGDPDRRAWHRAAASLAPDESVAGALVETADRARRRGGYRVAAAALERAAQLSERGWSRARRLLDASDLAVHAGEPWWVEALTGEVAAATDDPGMLAEAALRRGWALAATGRQKAALSQLLPLAADMMDASPVTALDAVSHSAVVLYCSGDEVFRRQAQELLARVPGEVGSAYEQVWARACCDPFGDRRGALAALHRAAAEADGVPGRLSVLGGAAWILDETALGVRLLSAVMERLRTVTTAGSSAMVGQTLALAQFDAGAWEAACESAEDARRVAEENGLEAAAWVAVYVSAMVLALRGEDARGLMARAVRGLDMSESRALGVRMAMVRAAVAAAEGDHALEFELLRGLFTAGPDPRPVHYHCSLYGVGDLAAAAVRVGRPEEAVEAVDAVERWVGEGMSPRLRLIVGRARALLCEGEEAEELFRTVVGDPVGEQWPFERAVVSLEFGEWLRRRRRMSEARAELARALTVFERLKAHPWVERTAGELRACGVPVRDAEGHPGSVERLTPQQLQIARLAAAGLTNRQIGERLLLSARTVGFHLYQAFPKLGVSSRTQLRDALSRAQSPREGTPDHASGTVSRPAARPVAGPDETPSRLVSRR